MSVERDVVLGGRMQSSGSVPRMYEVSNKGGLDRVEHSAKIELFEEYVAGECYVRELLVGTSRRRSRE